MTLSAEKIKQLLATADAPKSASGPCKWFDGNEWQSGQTLPPVGSFSGKAGTGRRYLNTGGVIAYKA